MKKILKTMIAESLRTILVFALIAGSGFAYAAWNTKAKSGDTLSSTQWNEIIDRIGVIEGIANRANTAANSAQSTASAAQSTANSANSKPSGGACPSGKKLYICANIFGKGNNCTVVGQQNVSIYGDVKRVFLQCK